MIIYNEDETYKSISNQERPKERKRSAPAFDPKSLTTENRQFLQNIGFKVKLKKCNKSQRPYLT